MDNIPGRWTLWGLAGRYFRWRMRGAAACLALAAPPLDQPPQALICSSMLNLAELRGLVPELATVPALVYFHENQLAYPAPGAADATQQERDLFLAFSNLTSALTAQAVVFNSDYHRQEFLGAAQGLVDRLPDARPRGLVEKIAAKSLVLPVPLEPGPARESIRAPRAGPLRILWNHRWSQDKDPQGFFAALLDLAGQGAEFQVAVLGPRAGRWPRIFDQARRELGRRLAQWGPVESRDEYWSWLGWADLVVSCARQEYQGLAVAEAIWAGCRPLLPQALVYPQLYPAEFLYPPGRLLEALAPLVARPSWVREADVSSLVENLTWQGQAPAWNQVLEHIARGKEWR